MCEKFKAGEVTIRDATADDMTAVCEMIQECAESQNIPDGPKLTARDLQYDGFDTQPPAFWCKVAEMRSTCYIIGYAIYFPTYSSWEGKSMMLEDLYVRSKFRRRGVGYKLVSNVTMEALKMGRNRLDFHVVAWNDASKYCEAAGAQNLTENKQWCYYSLSGNAFSFATSRGHLQTDKTCISTSDYKL